MNRAGRPGPAAPRRRLETALILALTLGIAVLYLSARDVGPFQAVEGMTLNWRFAIRGPQPPGPHIAVVTVDERTLAELGRWPFSRGWLARALDGIAAAGARAIAFDLLLAGSETRGAVAGRRGLVVAGAHAPPDEADRELAEAMARAGDVVVPYAFVFDTAEANLQAPPPTIEAAAYRLVLEDPARPVDLPRPPAGILAPLTAFLAAGRPAHVTVLLDADGGLRQAHPVLAYRDAYYPGLPVEAARLFLGLAPEQVVLELGAGLAVGERYLATGRGMALAIDYAGPERTYPTFSLIDAINGSLPEGALRDRLVLVGATAPALADRFVTPYDARLPGVEVFANVADNILTRGFLRRSPVAETYDLAAIALGGLLAAALGRLRRIPAALLAAAALTVAWCVLNYAAFQALQLWLSFVFPAAAILLGTTVVVAGRSLREARLRRHAEQQQASLSRYVSPLAAGRLRGESSGETAAVMFVDLVAFTHLSEAMTPTATADLLRRFHRGVERAAGAHRGTIDKFVGDAVLVVFGLPEGDAADALRCARAVAAEVAVWRAELEAAGEPGVGCGIGLHFGPVAVAEVGGAEHAQITVTGDTVNVASRLQELSRRWQTTIVASNAVVEAARAAGAVLEGFTALPLQAIRGREQPLAVWVWPPPAN